MYNKSEIMRKAHQLRASTNAQYKKEYAEFVACYGEATAKRFGWDRKMTMSEALKMAWADAKFNASHQDPEHDLFVLKMKDRWDESDFDYARKLEREIAAKAA